MPLSLCYVIPFLALNLIFFSLSLYTYPPPPPPPIHPFCKQGLIRCFPFLICLHPTIWLQPSFMGIFFSRNLPFKFFFPFLFSKKVSGHLFPKQLENMMCLVARTGRHLQRYDDGCRQVVGCIPYRYRRKGTQKKELEVLVISTQNGNGMQFPKGGWETDESMEQAALRETIEEAGVVGNIESKLGKWSYKSKRQDTVHEGYMFPLLVKKQLENWPEKNIRKRRWMSVAEAKEVCPHTWMKEALDVLVSRQPQTQPLPARKEGGEM